MEISERLNYQKLLIERDIDPNLYSQLGIDRIDWVHMPLDLQVNNLNPRERLIISRIMKIQAEAPELEILKCSTLEEGLDDIKGKMIVIGGGISDVCCEIRYNNLREAGAFPFYDMALITSY